MAKLPQKVNHDDGLGNKRFEIVQPNCKICKLDPDTRQRIDMMLATGWSQTYVREFWNDLLEDKLGPSYLNNMNLSRHARNHVSTREAAIRKIVEERARQLGIEVDETVGLMLTKEAVLEAIVQNGLENLIRGFTMAEPKEMITAIQTLKEFETETSEVGIDELWKQYHAFADAVKYVVPSEMFDRIVQRFDMIMGRMPVLENVNLQAPKEIEQTIEVEVIEVEDESIASWVPTEESEYNGHSGSVFNKIEISNA